MRQTAGKPHAVQGLRIVWYVFTTIALVAPGYAWASMPTVVFRHVNVVPMTDQVVLTDQIMIVRGSTIEKVAPEGSVRPPIRSQQIDGHGLFLMPGLVDTHTHPDGVAELASFLRYGQTTIFTLNGEGKALRDQNARLRPNILTSTTTIDGPGMTLNTRFHVLGRADDAPAVLDFEKRHGADFIKIYGQLNEGSVDALDREGAKRGLAIVGHLPRGFPIERSLPHMRAVAHTEEFLHVMSPDASYADLEKAADLAARDQVWLMTTSVTMTGQPRHMLHLDLELADPELRFLSDATYQQWLPRNDRYAMMSGDDRVGYANEVKAQYPKLKQLTLLMYRRGVPLLAGTDTPIFCYPGKCLLEELQILRDSGLSTFEVLKTATVNPGRFARDVIKQSPEFGTVTQGSRADLILLGSNPLESLDALKDLRGTMTAGRWMSAASMDVVREQLAAKLQRRHALIDEYERLLSAKNYVALSKFAKRLTPADVTFNTNVAVDDAQRLQQDGLTPEAVSLITEFTRLLPREFAVWNELGRLQALNHDYNAARAAYACSLRLRPRNGSALAALKELSDLKQNSR